MIFNNKKIKELEENMELVAENFRLQSELNKELRKKIDSLASHLNLEWKSKAVKKFVMSGTPGVATAWNEEAVLEYGYEPKITAEDKERIKRRFANGIGGRPNEGEVTISFDLKDLLTNGINATPKKSVKRKK